MISTFYGMDQLVMAPSGKTFLAAMMIGLLFGFALERAGFGSSRKLAAIFYFRDMTVLKVIYLYRSEDEDKAIPSTPAFSIAMVVCVAAILAIGVLSGPLLDWSLEVGRNLL